MVLRVASLPEDIVTLGVDSVNQSWKDAKLRGIGIKRAKTLVEAAEHSIGSREAQETARVELKILLRLWDADGTGSGSDGADQGEDHEVPYVDKLLEIRGVGLKTVIGFVSEVEDITHFDDPQTAPEAGRICDRQERIRKAQRRESHQLPRQEEVEICVVWSGDQRGEPQSGIPVDSPVLHNRGEESPEEDAVDDCSGM